MRADWKWAAPYLEVRVGKRKTSYRLNYRADGLKLRQVLEGEFRTVKKAKEAADKIIHEAKYGKSPDQKTFTRCSEVAEQLIAESRSQKEKTQEGKENIFRNHLLPWLDEHYPYASQLTVETWPKYKAYKRGLNPTIALENHVKYFRMLRKRAFELGLIRQLFAVKFDLKKEEFRKPGQVIPPEHEAALQAEFNRAWRDRSAIQRDTGMRPGEVRNLAKDRVRFVYRAGKRIAVVSLLETDTKTHRARSFEIHSERAVEALWRRFNDVDSPYFFPMETDRNRPMDKHLGGWNGAIRRANAKRVAAGLEPMPDDYTPHDWRHTYADDMFKRTGPDRWAALCYQLDMSLETAQKVYIHFKTSDTTTVAEIAANREIA